MFLFLSLCADSECGVRSGSVAALLPAGLPSLSQPQLCGSPGGRGGGSDPGRGGAAELRAAAPGTVSVLDLRLRLHPVCALRRLLERFRLQLAGRATAAAAVTPQTIWAGTKSDPTSSAWIRGETPGFPIRSHFFFFLFKPVCCSLHYRRTLAQVASDKRSRQGSGRNEDPPGPLSREQQDGGGGAVDSSLNCLIHLSPTVPSHGDIRLMKVSLHSCLSSTQNIAVEKKKQKLMNVVSEQDISEKKCKVG